MPGFSRADARTLFASNGLFRALGDSEIDGLLAYARRVRYHAGSEIFAKGAPGTSLMAVLDGTVRVSVVSENGREIVLNLIQAGEILGEIALLDGGERTADAIAMTECELLVLNRRDFLPFLERRADVCIKVIELLCQRLRQTSGQVEELSFWQLESRLAKALLRLAHDHRHPDGGTGPVRLRITQRELGGIVGGSREHVNKQLQTWQKAGFIELGKGEIIVRNRDALAKFCEQPPES